MCLRLRKAALPFMLLTTFAARVELGGQVPPRAQDTGLILGRVLDERTAEPVSGAVVSLSSRSTPPVRDRVRTDDEGRFVFFNLPAAMFTLTVIKAGYVSLPQRVTLGERERIGDLDLRIGSASSAGVIAGHVFDDAGEPVVGVEVRLLSPQTSGSGVRFWQAGGATTDDLGAYRIARRGPGTYLVMVPSIQASIPIETLTGFQDLRQGGQTTVPLQSELVEASAMDPGVDSAPPAVGSPGAVSMGTSVAVLDVVAKPPTIDADGRPSVFPTTFYPAATSLSSAARVELDEGAGVEGVDIRLAPEPAARVEGTLNGPMGAVGHLAVRLVLADPLPLRAEVDVATTVSEGSGRFTFPAVPAGEYVLKVLHVPRERSASTAATVVDTGAERRAVYQATRADATSPTPAASTLWANVPVSVGRDDVTGLDVAVHYGARVSGRLVFEGPTTPPEPAQLTRLRVAVDRPNGVAVTGSILGAGRFVGATVQEDGTFTTAGVPAGQYLVGVSGRVPGWTVKSVTWRNRDVTETPLEIVDLDLNDVVITMTDRISSIAGVVRSGGAGVPLDDAVVVVFPADPARWEGYGSSSRRIRRAAVSRNGEFTVPDLPPGDYLALALDHVPDIWQEIDGLSVYARLAVPVTVAEGQAAALSLVVQRAPRRQP